MRSCPKCADGTVYLRTGWAIKKITINLNGERAKVPAHQCYVAVCSAHCGWSVAGHIVGTKYDQSIHEFLGGTFQANPSLQPVNHNPLIELEPEEVADVHQVP